MRALSNSSETIDSFAVIDIGSNSVRLVVFDVESGYPVPLHNESVSCGLGRGVGLDGALPDDAVECALDTVVRYTRFARNLDVGALELVATAAVRDASNGADFVAAILSRTGCEARILDGAEEARLAGLGVAAGFREPNGVVGDLGCGSLELIRIGPKGLGEAVTLPVGALRVDARFGGDLAKIEEEVAAQLKAVPWLGELAGQTFYAVGGSWRALARIHMAQRQHPLHIIHAYAIDRRPAEDFAGLIAGLGRKSLSRIPGVSPRRVDMLPAAAIVFRRVIAAGGPERVVFSAAGLREGLVYDRIVRQGTADDPLLAAAESMAEREGRFGDVGGRLHGWMSPLFLNRHKARDRLRLAACILSDVGWREHPDYRAEQAMLRVLRHPFLAIDHPERAFVALAIYTRYGGKPDADAVQAMLPLVSKRGQRRAEVLGRALRLAYRISGGDPDLLARSELSVADGSLQLKLPKDARLPDRAALERSFKNLARAARLTAGRIRA